MEDERIHSRIEQLVAEEHEAGHDPDAAQVRDPEVVERYEE